jgi:hypothetical protein
MVCPVHRATFDSSLLIPRSPTDRERRWQGGVTYGSMAPIDDPAQLTHPKLQEFAVIAAGIATLTETAHDLEDLPIDVPPAERALPDGNAPWS